LTILIEFHHISVKRLISIQICIDFFKSILEFSKLILCEDQTIRHDISVFMLFLFCLCAIDYGFLYLYLI